MKATESHHADSAEGFDVPVPKTSPAAARRPDPGEPDTDPRGKLLRKSAPAPAPASPSASTVGEPAPATPSPESSLLNDLRRRVLKAARAEAEALLAAYRTFQRKDESMADFFDPIRAAEARDRLINTEMTPDNVEDVMRRWAFFSEIANNPQGLPMARRIFENWRIREFEAIRVAATAFHQRMTAEVDAIKAKAVESERGFFRSLLGVARKPAESAAGSMIDQQCECLLRPGRTWEADRVAGEKTGLHGAGVHMPGTLLELAEQAVTS